MKNSYQHVSHRLPWQPTRLLLLVLPGLILPVWGSGAASSQVSGAIVEKVASGSSADDPTAPQVFPADTGEDDRDTADVSERALADLQSERRLNTPTKVRDALDAACTYGSGYIVYTIDPTGGGRVVRTMQAPSSSRRPQERCSANRTISGGRQCGCGYMSC